MEYYTDLAKNFKNTDRIREPFFNTPLLVTTIKHKQAKIDAHDVIFIIPVQLDYIIKSLKCCVIPDQETKMDTIVSANISCPDHIMYNWVGQADLKTGEEGWTELLTPFSSPSPPLSIRTSCTVLEYLTPADKQKVKRPFLTLTFNNKSNTTQNVCGPCTLYVDVQYIKGLIPKVIE